MLVMLVILAPAANETKRVSRRVHYCLLPLHQIFPTLNSPRGPTRAWWPPLPTETDPTCPDTPSGLGVRRIAVDFRLAGIRFGSAKSLTSRRRVSPADLPLVPITRLRPPPSRAAFTRQPASFASSPNIKNDSVQMRPLPQSPATPPAQLRPNHRKFQPKSPLNACYFHGTLVLLCCHSPATQPLRFPRSRELSS
jgi:hypothetical protein